MKPWEFVGISVGAGIMVSQYFGAREREKLSATIGNCITLTAIATLFFQVFFFQVKNILHFFQPDHAQDSRNQLGDDRSQCHAVDAHAEFCPPSATASR